MASRDDERPLGRKLFRLPLVLFVLYIFGTFTLYVLGPIGFPDDENVLGAGLYVAAAIALFALGYQIAARSPARSTLSGDRLGRRLRPLFLGGLLLGALLQLLQLWGGIERAGGPATSALLNPGERYRAAVTAAGEDASSERSLAGQLVVLSAPLTWLVLPIALARFGSLGWMARSATLATVLLRVLAGVLALGTFKRVGDAAIVIASAAFLSAARGELSYRKLKVWVPLGALAVFAYFTFHQASRLTAYEATDAAGIGQMRFEKDHVVFRVLGQETGAATAIALSYVTQGYYPLGLCLKLPFEWTFGLGHSLAALGYADQYLGIKDLLARTYPLRLMEAEGHSGLTVWHTIFPWLASDLTFPGALGAMGLLGWLYASTWAEAVRFGNPISTALFAYLNIVLVFVPCNNQVCQQRESAIALYAICVLWLLFHRRLNRAGVMDTLTTPQSARRGQSRINPTRRAEAVPLGPASHEASGGAAT